MSGKKHGDKRKVEAVSDDDKTKIKKESNNIPIIDDKTKMKRSSRNASEKRRRDKLNTYINELSAMVPSCSSPHSSRKLDKSTILKLTVSYMRLHADLLSPSTSESTVSWKPAFLSNEELGTLMLEALDGFLFVLTETGRVLYVSHTVAPLLGHLQSNLLGRSLFDIVHEDDKAALQHTLKAHFSTEMLESSSSAGNKAKVGFTIRMLRGGMNSYELVHCSGNVRRWEDAIKNPSQDGEIGCMTQGLLDTEDNPTHCLVAVGKMEAPKIIRDISSLDLGKNEYLSRHSLEAKYLYVDNKAASIIGYLPSEVIGCSAYDFYHLDDLSILASNHKNLMNHGNSATMFYRFLTKGQQWIWMQTHGYVETNKWTNKPETIICHNVVVSYSKVLEYLHTRAMEYGPALPPIAGSSPKTPQEFLIGALTSNHRLKSQLLPQDRISDVTPIVQKEEPPSPPVIGGVTISGSRPSPQPFTSQIPPLPDNLYPRQNIFQAHEASQQTSTSEQQTRQPAQIISQGYSKMDVDLSPGSVQSNDHGTALQHPDVATSQHPQQLQHMPARGPVINLSSHNQPIQQHIQQQIAAQQQAQQQPSQQIHVQHHVQQPSPQQHVQHQVPQHAVPRTPPMIQNVSNGQHVQQPVQQMPQQPATPMQQPSTPMHVQHHEHSQQHSTRAQQQHNSSNQSSMPQHHQQQQQNHHAQPQQQPTQHSISQQQQQTQHNMAQPRPTQPAQHSPHYVQHNSQPGTPLPDKMVHSPRHMTQPPTQLLLLPQSLSTPQQAYIANSPQHGPVSQLRPTINLQGMQYVNVNPANVSIDSKVNNHQQRLPNNTNILSPNGNVHQVAEENSNSQFTSANNIIKAQNIAQYATSQISAQPYSIIPTSGGGALQPNSNVIMIQEPITGQYQLAQLYPLIQAVQAAPTNGNNITHKLITSQNGATPHLDLSKNTAYTIPNIVQGVKREEVSRCGVKSPGTLIHSNSEEYLSSANSDHVLDQIDPEVISMILNTTNIDNFNLDNQWNPNLFDNPPKSTHSTSSNPSPISAHSPGT